MHRHLKNRKNYDDTTRFIITYNRQHSCVCGILQKHWYLLINDPILKKYTGERPNNTFRQARSFRDRLTKSNFVDTEKEDQTLRGTLKCNSSHFCSCIFENHTMYLPNVNLHSIIHSIIYHVNCQTGGRGVYYVL